MKIVITAVLLAFTVLLTNAGAQQLTKEEAIEAIDARLPGRLVNDPFDAEWKVTGGRFARVETVDAPQIPGQRAIQVKVRHAQRNPWDVMISMSLGDSVEKDDVILWTFWARVVVPNSNDQPPVMIARIARDREPYDHIISKSVKLAKDWRLYSLSARATASMPSDEIDVSFHMGTIAQTLEFGQFYVTNLSAEGDIASLPSGSLDLAGKVHADLPEPVDVKEALKLLGMPKAAPSGENFHPGNAGWELVWSDEFDGAALNGDKWASEESCWGGGNNERQCYTARHGNVQVVNGLLRLIALREDFTGPLMPPELDASGKTAQQPYTSGKVGTRGLADWKYGRFEMRAMLPKGQGTWPAFWMMPSDAIYGSWPQSGEIDIMEAANLGAACDNCDGDHGENTTSSAVHFGGPGADHKFIERRTQLRDKSNPADGYHVWAAEWGEGVIKFYLDGRHHFTVRADDWYTVSEVGRKNPNAPFDQPFFLMINLAIGGTYSENRNELGVSEDAAPSQMLVDWVRVYQCAEDMETGLACMRG